MYIDKFSDLWATYIRDQLRKAYKGGPSAVSTMLSDTILMWNYGSKLSLEIPIKVPINQDIHALVLEAGRQLFSQLEFLYYQWVKEVAPKEVVKISQIKELFDDVVNKPYSRRDFWYIGRMAANWVYHTGDLFDPTDYYLYSPAYDMYSPASISYRPVKLIDYNEPCLFFGNLAASHDVAISVVLNEAVWGEQEFEFIATADFSIKRNDMVRYITLEV